MIQHLIEQLRECAEWAEANIWEVPVILPDLLKEAADKIEVDKKEIERLKQDETVKPVVHGKWIRIDMHSGKLYKCSACEGSYYVPECMGEPMYYYCPNCGARMDLEDTNVDASTV